MSKPTPSDTIAAIATGIGGGIGIVRISGNRSESILKTVLPEFPNLAASHTLHFGVAVDDKNERIDEVLGCIMRAPRSYTSEDVAELQGHGGALSLARLLQATLAAGARQAEPGEFTRRAFLSGRIDLTQAEAVSELIAARSESSLRTAQALQSGALATRMAHSRQELVAALGELEGALDFPDEDLDLPLITESTARLQTLATELSALANTKQHSALRPPEIVFVGRSNSGKSTLFNALLEEERALTDAHPGTTRDALLADWQLHGVAVTLTDTAGERFDDAPGGVEARGIALGRRHRDRADLVVQVVDGAIGFDDDDEKLWQSLKGRNRLLVWNKCDLRAPSLSSVATSATVGTGLSELRQALTAALGGGDPDSNASGVLHRHADALGRAATLLLEAAALLPSGAIDVAAVAMRQALHAIGEISGETLDEEVLDAIFARFCIGK